MVGSGYVVKVGDFGMARAMYGSDYYRFGRKGMSWEDKPGDFSRVGWPWLDLNTCNLGHK